MNSMKYWKLSNPWKGTAALTSINIDDIDTLNDVLEELKDIKLTKEEYELAEVIYLQIIVKVKDA